MPNSLDKNKLDSASVQNSAIVETNDNVIVIIEDGKYRVMRVDDKAYARHKARHLDFRDHLLARASYV